MQRDNLASQLAGAGGYKGGVVSRRGHARAAVPPQPGLGGTASFGPQQAGSRGPGAPARRSEGGARPLETPGAPKAKGLGEVACRTPLSLVTMSQAALSGSRAGRRCWSGQAGNKGQEHLIRNSWARTGVLERVSGVKFMRGIFACNELLRRPAVWQA
jgi:hypothetical protein